MNINRKRITRIRFVGFEIEGEMTLYSQAMLEKYGTVKNDGSLHLCRTHGQSEETALECRELASVKFRLKDKPKIKKVFTELHNQYRQKQFHYNRTCGFHVHVSFLPKLPDEIFSSEFQLFFYNALKHEFPEVIRRRGKNRFCKIVLGNKDIAERERYRFINFYTAYKSHGTIEFRIFPSAQPKQMHKYLLFTIRTIKKFLAHTPEITVHEIADVEVSSTLEPLHCDTVPEEVKKRCLKSAYAFTAYPPRAQEAEYKL